MIIKELQNYGQLKIGPIEIAGEAKARISGNFIPDFTIDLTKPAKRGILSLINPKITLLIAGNAYEIGWGEKKLKRVDPIIFKQDTFLDTINKIGIIPIVLLAGVSGFLIYMLIKGKKG